MSFYLIYDSTKYDTVYTACDPARAGILCPNHISRAQPPDDVLFDRAEKLVVFAQRDAGSGAQTLKTPQEIRAQMDAQGLSARETRIVEQEYEYRYGKKLAGSAPPAPAQMAARTDAPGPLYLVTTSNPAYSGARVFVHDAERSMTHEGHYTLTHRPALQKGMNARLIRKGVVLGTANAGGVRFPWSGRTIESRMNALRLTPAQRKSVLKAYRDFSAPPAPRPPATQAFGQAAKRPAATARALADLNRPIRKMHDGYLLTRKPGK